MTAPTPWRRRLLPWLPVFAVMAGIFVLSSQSGLKVSEDPVVERPIRATGHLLAYATLAALSLVALSWGRVPRLRDAVIAFAIAVAYGLSDELHQSFVPERSGRLDDVLTDIVGALIGIVVAVVVLTAAAHVGTRREDSA